MNTPHNSKHINTLDSLRGMATISVFLSHMWSFNLPERDMFRPWLFLFAGHEAVILFFVLSGFVLTLSYEKKSISYLQYAICRIFRIYPAYYLCMLVEIILFVLIKPVPLTNYTPWFNAHFSTIKLTTKTILDIIFLVTNPESKLNGVIWSLVYEVIISVLILPIFWKIKNKKVLIALGFVYILFFISRQIIPIPYKILDETLYFSVFFYIGYLISYFQDKLAAFAKIKYLPLYVFCYSSIYFAFGYAPFDKATIRDFLTGIGAFYFICLALYNPLAKSFLQIKVINFYGKISYSFYLFHICVMYGMVYLLTNILPLSIIICLIFLITTLVSYLVYIGIEKPFIRLGKKITFS